MLNETFTLKNSPLRVVRVAIYFFIRGIVNVPLLAQRGRYLLKAFAVSRFVLFGPFCCLRQLSSRGLWEQRWRWWWRRRWLVGALADAFECYLEEALARELAVSEAAVCAVGNLDEPLGLYRGLCMLFRRFISNGHLLFFVWWTLLLKQFATSFEETPPIRKIEYDLAVRVWIVSGVIRGETYRVGTGETSLSTGHRMALMAFVALPRPGCRDIWAFHCFLKRLLYSRVALRWTKKTMIEHVCNTYLSRISMKRFRKWYGNNGNCFLKEKGGRKLLTLIRGKGIKEIGLYTLSTATW